MCIHSPINHTGRKKPILDQIVPLFPQTDVFVEPFVGSGDVFINVEAKRYFLNDKQSQIINLLKSWQTVDIDELFSGYNSLIEIYQLSKTNKEGYLQLRTEYNWFVTEMNLEVSGLFYMLCCHSFSNQIRFNLRGEFNLPFGKRTFNNSMKEKLVKFVGKLQTKDISFHSLDFVEFLNLVPACGAFIYLDPPYTTGIASYNERFWSVEKDLQMFKILDSTNCKWALSNVLENNGKQNTGLIEWLSTRDYKVHHIDHSYKGSNYHRKNKGKTREVLITNYE